MGTLGNEGRRSRLSDRSAFPNAKATGYPPNKTRQASRARHRQIVGDTNHTRNPWNWRTTERCPSAWASVSLDLCSRHERQPDIQHQTMERTTNPSPTRRTHLPLVQASPIHTSRPLHRIRRRSRPIRQISHSRRLRQLQRPTRSRVCQQKNRDPNPKPKQNFFFRQNNHPEPPLGNTLN